MHMHNYKALYNHLALYNTTEKSILVSLFSRKIYKKKKYVRLSLLLLFFVF